MTGTVGFKLVPPIDGTVKLSPDDSHIQAVTFDEYARVPFRVDKGTTLVRHADRTMYSANPTTGEVVRFDLDGRIIGSVDVPLTLDTIRLHDVALGPEDTVYALYVGSTLTVVASTFESPSREIRRWSFGEEIAMDCVEFCYLSPMNDGFGWDGHGQALPYLNAADAEIVGPARPIDSSFTTDWEPVGGLEPPRTVTVTGPLDRNGTLYESAWSVRLEQVVFNGELFNSFNREVDDSYTASVVFERELNVEESRRPVFLWLRSDGFVSALDPAGIAGLKAVIVRSDGALIGVVEDQQGLRLGTLSPL